MGKDVPVIVSVGHQNAHSKQANTIGQNSLCWRRKIGMQYRHVIALSALLSVPQNWRWLLTAG